MPFQTLYASTVMEQWFPPEIDAYTALKITHINLTVTNNSGGGLSEWVVIGFDEEVDPTAPPVPGNDSEIKKYLSIPATDTISITLNNLDKIVGDFIAIISGNVAFVCSATVFYDILKTKFDQYGQASKTIKRVLER